MLTRRAVARDMEDKLRATLKELESSKSLCKQLLQERDDSEVEVKNIVDKNTSLKNELAELHVVHMDLLDQHHHLQHHVSTFKQCSDTHERALSRITELEHELSKAHSTITFLESVKSREQDLSTQSLFDELVGCSSTNQPIKPIVTIDLTEECSMSEGSWRPCHKCGAALRTDVEDFHVNCIPIGMDEWKCPYCFTNVLARDLPWQRHLMQCPRNPRITQSS